MSELDKLRAALRATTPQAEPDAKARALALAKENFARHQETANPARPIDTADQKRPHSKGLFAMFKKSKLRPVLYATTCLVVAGFAFVSYPALQNDLTTPVLLGETDAIEAETPALTRQSEERLRDDVSSADAAVEGLTKPKREQFAPKPSQLKKRTNSTNGALAQSTAGIVALDLEVAPQPQQTSSETFPNASENPLKVTAETPVSTFSIDVDTASYAYVRNAILNGQRPNADAVRIEEMVNYFTYDYPAPTGEHPFSTTLNVMQTPWNPDTQLVQIGIQGALPEVENRPPLNLVFLIDTSGSMNQPNKLPLLKQSFRLMLSELRPTDQVAIVTYAGSAGLALKPTAAADAATILASLDTMHAGGSTAGQAGLQQAYAVAQQMKTDDAISRVILATDGDFNVGINNPDQLKSFIEGQRDSGTYLSVLGFGRGNYRDDMMQMLAQNGNGTAAYIDTLAEAQKVLVDQLTGSLFPIANDVKIQVEFNPAKISEYRLIGYETRALNREDFNNDKVDAGEIGAGHQVTALYEVTPTGSPAQKVDPLRYGTTQQVTSESDELGFLKLRYKTPGADSSNLIEQPIHAAQGARLPAAGFAAAVAGFGQLLKGSDYTENWSFEDAIALAQTSKGSDKFGYRTEAIRLMKLAQSLK